MLDKLLSVKAQHLLNNSGVQTRHVPIQGVAHGINVRWAQRPAVQNIDHMANVTGPFTQAHC